MNVGNACRMGCTVTDLASAHRGNDCDPVFAGSPGNSDGPLSVQALRIERTLSDDDLLCIGE